MNSSCQSDPPFLNEWVPVFRAQAAAANKMAFKAFFLAARSQTKTTALHLTDLAMAKYI